MTEIYDADEMQAGLDEIQRGPFADVEPFDPEQFISDVIGS